MNIIYIYSQIYILKKSIQSINLQFRLSSFYYFFSHLLLFLPCTIFFLIWLILFFSYTTLLLILSIKVIIGLPYGLINYVWDSFLFFYKYYTYFYVFLRNFYILLFTNGLSWYSYTIYGTGRSKKCGIYV